MLSARAQLSHDRSRLWLGNMQQLASWAHRKYARIGFSDSRLTYPSCMIWSWQRQGILMTQRLKFAATWHNQRSYPDGKAPHYMDLDRLRFFSFSFSLFIFPSFLFPLLFFIINFYSPRPLLGLVSGSFCCWFYVESCSCLGEILIYIRSWRIPGSAVWFLVNGMLLWYAWHRASSLELDCFAGQIQYAVVDIDHRFSE